MQRGQLGPTGCPVRRTGGERLAFHVLLVEWLRDLRSRISTANPAPSDEQAERLVARRGALVTSARRGGRALVVHLHHPRVPRLQWVWG